MPDAEVGQVHDGEGRVIDCRVARDGVRGLRCLNGGLAGGVGEEVDVGAAEALGEPRRQLVVGVALRAFGADRASGVVRGRGIGIISGNQGYCLSEADQTSGQKKEIGKHC